MSEQNTQNNSEKNEEELLLDHDYDGIRELDNPLPMWWLATFYITIIFGILYMNYYMLGSGPSLKEELHQATLENEAKISANKPKEGPADESKLQSLLADAAQVSSGKQVYDKNCQSCHGPQAQGLVGPNLTDSSWIHGKGKLVDIHKVVSEGVLEKGMPAWAAVLKPEEVNQVVVYIKSLKGTNPPNAKAPQGEEVKE